jgi:Capsule assembly protein Wzi
VIVRIAALCAAAVISSSAGARGVSPYLPLSLSPEIERQIERVMILAERPLLTRPLTAAAVLDALPAACARDAAACEPVRRYLSSFMRSSGLTHASLALSGGSKDAEPMPNRRGMESDSLYELSANLYWQPSDFVLVNAGLLAYEDETVPTGSMVSLGMQYAQLDIGYRDHWLSPMTDSAMLISTNAETMPSITLSSYAPMTRLGLRYEIFLAEMSYSDQIAYENGLTAGHPRLAGVHVSFEPLPGWAIGFNRILQFGGGDRPDSFSDLLQGFFRPNEADNTGTVQDFGNQAASVTARFVMPGKVPFAVYFEYAGEDTSTNNNLRLGNVALLGGIHFPTLGPRLDLTVELGEWQNAWYAHHIYRDGLRSEGNVIGHWGADRRVLNDAVGAHSVMARIGWQPRLGGLLEATYRTLENESYSAPAYERAQSLEVRYSRMWRDFYYGVEMYVSDDVFGESHARLGAFLRF